MFKQSDKKKSNGGRSGDVNQPSITNFFAKKPSASKQNLQNPALPTRDFTQTYMHATSNSSALTAPAVPKSGYQGNQAGVNNSSMAPNQSFGASKPRVFNSYVKPPVAEASLSRNMFSLVGAISTEHKNTKDTRVMSKPAPRGGPLTGNGSGVYVVSKRPASSQQSGSKQALAPKKRPAPWGAKEPESIRFSKPPPTSNNPFRKGSGLAPKGKPRITRSQLSPDQLRVVDAIFNRKNNVFFTGSAGTGKSFLLQYIISELRGEQEENGGKPWPKGFGFVSGGGEGLLSDTLAITASTGIAAFQLGGTTIHSFAGIGLGDGTVASLVTRVNKNRKTLAKWLGLKHLIIDEISMLEGDLFAKLDQLARSLRRSSKPFGGIQLILAGDFFQLPPVSRNQTQTFCFESPSWKTCITETIVLEQIFRQRDIEFSTILNEARIGRLSEKAINTFKSLSRPVAYPNDGIQATEIYSTRNEVDFSNNRRLATLSGEMIRLEAKDFGTDHYAIKNLDSQTMFPKLLELKINAQVMLVKNMTQKHTALVNGSLGVVTGFHEANLENGDDELRGFGQVGASASQAARPGTTQLYPRVRFTSGVELLITPEETTIERNNVVVASRHQVPLVLAWALSIHKAQGQTLDRLKVDLSRVFEKGQAYVALSRATSLQSLQVLSFDPSKVVAHPKVAEFYRSCLEKS